jgi:hypothetical protein
MAAVLGRLTWMLFGPFVLFLTICAVLGSGKRLLASADVVYFAALVVMLLGRCLEFRSGHALTAEGAPATAGHLRRYLLRTATIGLTLWIVAIAIRRFVLPG